MLAIKTVYNSVKFRPFSTIRIRNWWLLKVIEKKTLFAIKSDKMGDS